MSGLANYPRALAFGGNQATATVVHGPEPTLARVAANGSSEPNVPKCCGAAKVGL